jgi:hypothetical protein
VDAAPVALPGTTPSCTAPDDGRLLDLAATGPVLPATPAHAAGVWRPVTDGTPGTISFAVEASNPMRCSTANALRFRGSGFTSWGAVAQAFFDNGPVNLSAFSGVRFSLRASAPISVRLKVPDRQAYQGGGLCAKCDDDFGAELAVGTAWREYVVPFASMRQEGWGSPLFMAIDGKQIYGLELLVRQNVSFDLWIDGVTLTR